MHVHNNGEPRQLGVKGTLTRGDRKVDLELPGEPLAKEGTEVLQTSVKIDDPALWSPRTPNLWNLDLEVPGETTYRARVGLREVAPRAPTCCSTATRSSCAAPRSTRTSSAAATACGRSTRTGSSPS